MGSDPTDASPHDALIATLDEARLDANAGRLDVAERRFLNVLQQTRGTASPAELRCLNDLVTIYSREQRDLETLPMARQLYLRAVDVCDPQLQCKALGAVAGAFSDIEDLERMARALDTLELCIGQLDRNTASVYWRLLAGSRSDLALRKRDFAAAHDELRRFRDTYDLSDSRDSERLWLWIHEAHVSLATDRPDEAVHPIAKARALAVPAAIGGIPLDYLELWATAETEGLHAARTFAEEKLLQASATPYGVHGISQRIRYFPKIAKLLREKCGEPRLAQMAFDLAGAAVVARIFQLNLFVQHPEWARLEGDDRQALAEYRARFKKDQRQLLESVSGLLCMLRGGSDWSDLQGVSREHTRSVMICAWCESVCSQNDQWVPIGHFVPDRGDLPVAHGICPDCETRLNKEVGGEQR